MPDWHLCGGWVVPEVRTCSLGTLCDSRPTQKSVTVDDFRQQRHQTMNRRINQSKMGCGWVCLSGKGAAAGWRLGGGWGVQMFPGCPCVLVGQKEHK
jgi:hypothetical protein